MRASRILILMAVWMAAVTLAGCRPAEHVRVPPEALVDTVMTTTVPATDTVSAVYTVTAPDPPPNDCRYADSRPRPRYGEPGFGERYEAAAMKRGVTYRCALRPGGPEVRLVVSGEDAIPMGVDVHSPPDAPQRMQQLLLDNSEGAYEGSELLVGEDLNGDGWMDLRVRTYSGTGGVMYDVFRYLPSSRRFVLDTVLSPGTNVERLPGRPCVRSGGRAGWGIWDHLEECWSGGAWVLTRRLDQERTDDGRYIRTEQVLRDGRMRVVRVDTLTDANEGL